jgi:hypothetical protein
MRHAMLVPLQLLTREAHPPVQESRAGDMYYNTKLDIVFVFNGTRWDGLKGAGSEEVVIQPMDPSRIDAELWVDTDDPGGPSGGGSGYLPLYGGQLSGPLTIIPTDPLQTALYVATGGIYVEAGGVAASNFTPSMPDHLTTKAYVDSLIGTGGGGGGGGGGGADEIIIQAMEPEDPALEVWINPEVTGVGGEDEIVVQTAEPTDPRLELWINPETPPSGLDGTFVNVIGDTMEGPLLLRGDPELALEAATKQYVDLHGGGMDPAVADARYVNVTGDTLTGPLTMGMNNVIFNNGKDQARLGLLQSFPDQVGYPTFKVELFDDSDSNGLVSLEVRPDGVMVQPPTLDGDATTKKYVNDNFARVTVSVEEPASPSIGDIWIYQTAPAR